MAGNTWNSTTKMEHRTKTETPLDPLSSPPPIKSWETSPIMTTLQEQYAKKKERHAIMKLIPEQISKLNVRFPIGCPVWADVTSQNIQRSDEDEKKSIPMSNNFNDAQDIVDWSECQKMLTKLRELEAHLAEKYGIINPHQTYAAMTNQSAQNNAQELTTFIEGRVISVWMELSDRGNVYEIELSGPLTRRLLFVPEGKLSFATDCPVSVMTKSNSWTPGRVLFGNQGMQHANSVEPYLYSVQIHQSCGVFQVVHGVGADRVKYHSVNDMTGTSSISRNIGCKQSAEQSVSGSSSSKEMKACDGYNDLEQMKTKGDTADHSVPEKYYQPVIGDKASKPHDALSDEPTAAKNNRNATKAAHPSKKDQEARQEDDVIKPQPLANQVGRGDTNLSVSSAAGSSTNGDKKRPRSTNSTSESHERQPLQKHAKVDQSSAARHHVFSRVGFPIWLVRENEVKDRLVYQLTKKRKHNDSGKALNVLESIGLETKCILQLKNDDTHYNRLYDRTHIYIGSGGGTDPKIGVRRAKEKVEDFLLEFIEHDGSKGRLFYNIGRSNTFFHLRSEKGGIANWPIMQRNPFSVHREMGWMSIVDLPYDKDPITGRKKYYGEHLLLKLRFRLRDELNCEMKLCGGELKKYPVRFGDPYVWLWGNRSENVERAVKLVQDHLI